MRVGLPSGAPVFVRRPKSNGSKYPLRWGTVLVEFALVISVFAVFMAGIIEFGHAYLVIGSLNAAARNAARLGAVDKTTTAEVQAEVQRILSSAFRGSGNVTIRVKDASVFDTAGVNPAAIDYASLPDVEVSNLTTGKLFLVRLEVNYSNVAVMPPFWAKNIILRSQTIVRHE